MSVERTLTATTHHLRRLHSHITRQRAALFAVTLVVVGLALGGLEKPAAAVQPAYHTVTDLMLPARVPSAPGADAPQPVSQEALSERLERVEVRPGQSLDAIFREQGFSVGLLQQILALNDETRALKRIRPGEQFAFQRHPDGSLSRMRCAIPEIHGSASD